ncbi:MAG TPA: hypothetical protein VHG53_07790 [Candidatus Limnocylindria bacterium]|nr:hypothetical protein [Candidatus Limnocylindria bacterium]
MLADRAVYRAFQFGLGIFALTALLGLANATQVFGPLSRDALLTHLHSGTLGWITMGVIGVAVWMFNGRGGSLARNVGLSGLATAIYVLAFWSGNFPARAITGTVELVVIYAWWWWVAGRARAEGFGHVDIPKLALVFGLTTLVIGSTLGVIVQIMFATGTASQTTGQLIGGHAAAQVGGYLVLVAAGIAEWQLTGGGSRSRAGVAQVAVLFLGGIVLAIGIFTNLQPLLGLATLLQVVGIVIVIVRFGKRAITAPWGVATGTRHIAASLLFLVLGVILEIMLVAALAQAKGDIGAVSAGLNHALDHTMFVALMTNALFGVILILTASGPRTWPWADHVIFWGLNLGVASFIAVLMFVGSGEGAKPFTHPVAFTAPIMGISALLGIVTLSMRLGAARRAAPPA